MVALAILTIGLLGVATMISRSTIQDARAYYQTQASLMVEETFENTSRLQYNATAFRNMNNINSNRSIDGVDYILNCTLLDDTPIPNCKEMTCIATWNNKGIRASTEMIYVYTLYQ